MKNIKLRQLNRKGLPILFIFREEVQLNLFILNML